MTTQAQIDANAANSRLSTGPRSASGKRVSRMNGLKHGMRATTLILPGEDPREFEEQVERLNKIVKPRDDMEVFLIHEYVARSWRTQRVRLAYDLRLLMAIDEADSREEDDAAKLGRLLLHDRRGPTPVYGAKEYYRGDRTSYTNEDDATPEPADLVKKLKATQAGCKWLLERWGELRARLEPGKFWESSDKFKAARLLGRQPLDAIDEPDVAYMYLGAYAINPNDRHAFMELRGELSDEELARFIEGIKRQIGPTINPGDWDCGRNLLKCIVDEHIRRLQVIALEHEENREVYVEERTARLRDDETPDGERFKRYDLASSRVLGRGLEAVWKHRRHVVKGIEDGVELINHSDVGKRFMMGDGSGTEILICSDGLARPDIKLDLTGMLEDRAKANLEQWRAKEAAAKVEDGAGVMIPVIDRITGECGPSPPQTPPLQGGETARGGDRRAEEGAIASPVEMVDPRERVCEGIGESELGGATSEEPRDLTTEANSANLGVASQAYSQLGVKEMIEHDEALDKPGQQGGDGSVGPVIAGSEGARDIRAMIDAIDGLVALSDFGEAMGAP